ncbi:MAG: hypothetical protein DRQ59_08205 [Gammaproteobacteria bacterium]|nr:MAG: hypothetical protein DRQ59_08205 [Gammaproteobacteria bacterium]
MKSYEFNLEQLEKIAMALGDLLAKVTFVGGCTTALLVDEAAFFGIRATDDVDIIVDVASRVEYHKIGKALRKRGFREDKEGPMCRWLLNSNDRQIKLDVMPIDDKILGFSNRWYGSAIKESLLVALPGGTPIQVVSPVYFIATKFEAFAGRGEGNYFSHDLEDIIFVMENRSGLILELADCSPELKTYFSSQASLLLNDTFLNVLPGLLNNSETAVAVEDSLKIMKSWA